MKTKHSPGEDPIIGFCKATSESQETALFFLEGFSWDLDNAVSGFLQGQLPPVKKQPLQRSRSRSPSRRIDSSVLRSKHYKMDAHETSKTLDDDDREPIGLAKEATHDEISHGEDLASMHDPI
ncbi:hypothetical protein Bca4012_038557 [Brassica carinata]|uniref:Uncharacterized protein n=1 Tax=Brassica carinata TaxID=52824 RepID=A0A8X8B7C1_BRACI|nr:hypothetical protein Bca52824_006886 [Brassica carinata]